MKYLLYYSLDNKFVNDQIAAQGDGKNVVSVVDGVAWTRDTEKAYYRYAPNVPEEVTTYYVTIHYKDIFGETIANDDIVPVEVYNGKGTNYCVVSKTIEGFIINQSSDTILVTGNCEYEFEYLSGDLKPEETPLTFTITGDGVIRWKTSNTSIAKDIQYKKNDGNWASITSNTGNSAPSISVAAGDVVQFRGNNTSYATSTSYNTFSGTTCQFKVYGNIMSLIDSTGFTTATTLASTHTFTRLFIYCTGLTSSKNLILPATTLTSNCYQSMFSNCTSLTQAPALPITTMAINCYQYMFAGCTSLTQAPELPATTLTSNCYQSMFSNCTSLTAAPALPATTLAGTCYESMFSNCTSLTTAPSILPATTLIGSCYSNMFRNCTSLTEAPELPATTLTENCYNYMFQGCTNLNYIKCLATDISASYCLNNWVNGVQTTSGTFIKSPDITESTWGRNSNGIPLNWTVQDATS